MKKAWHAVARALLVSSTLFPIYLSYFWVWVRGRFLGAPVPREKLARVHRKHAERFYRLAVRMRGGLIKIGQLISVRVDVAPVEWTSTLAKLQDKVEPTPWRDIERHLTEQYGAHPSEVFREIDERAVAAASFGQVHRAVTRDGDEVALKVKYADIDMKLGLDLAIFRRAVPLFNVFVPKVKLRVIYEEMSRALRTELDYEQEADWTQRIHHNMKAVPGVFVPRVYPEHTTKSVICTSFFRGHKITDKDRMAELGLELHDVIKIVIHAFTHMVFVDGLFQSDPHPGNLMFRRADDGAAEVCVLDFGQVKELPKDFQRKMVMASIAYMGRDVAGFKRGLVDLGLLTQKDADTAEPIIQEFFDHYFEMSPAEAKELDFDAIRKDVKQVVDRIDGLHIPQDIILYGRTLGLLSGVVTALDEEINGLMLAKPMIMECLMRPENFLPLDATA